MSYNTTLRAAIAAAIHTPADPPITGAELQAQLLAIVDAINAGGVFLGTAATDTVPGTTTNGFYLATTVGTYTNFIDTSAKPLVIAEGEIALLSTIEQNGIIRWAKNPLPGRGEAAYIHIMYAESQPAQDSDMHDTFQQLTDKYIGICADANETAPTDYRLYTWAKFVGEDGAPGRDAINPFKGWFDADITGEVGSRVIDNMANLPDNPSVGFYAYVKTIEVDPQDTSIETDVVKIYECATAGQWSDSGRTFQPSKDPSFKSGQSINAVGIDDTHLANPADGSLPKAEDVMHLSEAVGDVIFSETKADIGNLQSGYIDGANGNFVESQYFRTVDIQVTGYDSIRFLGLIRDQIYQPGYSLGYYNENNWVPLRWSKYPYDNSVTSINSKLKEFLVNIKDGETTIRITCRVYNTVLNENVFYAYLRQGTTLMSKIKNVSSMTRFEIPSTPNYINDNGVIVSASNIPSYSLTDYYLAYPGLQIRNAHAVNTGNHACVAFYDKNFQFISTINHSSGGFVDIVLNSSNIPPNAVYFRANINASYTELPITEFYINRVFGIDSELNENSSNLLTNSVITKATTYPLSYENTKYLGKNGEIISGGSSLTSFSVSDYCLALAGIKMYGLHAAAASASDYTYVAFYTENFAFAGRLRNQSTGKFNHTLTQEEIPENAKYFKACVWHEDNYDGYIDYRLPINLTNPIVNNNSNSNTVPFDYNKALSMPKQQLQTIVEAASNGRCTVLYDNDNYPSLMYKIPKISIGSLVEGGLLGGNSDVHPAFKVNGVEKDTVYLSVFEASKVNGHYVSWWGLPPIGLLNLYDLREPIASKGTGWHVETLYERSLLVLLTRCLNSNQPTGNTNKGRSHLHKYEYCQMVNGLLPGNAPGQPTGNKWINGTQPSAWSHNKELWGIQDVIGGYHEICDLYKLVNGQIYIASDNKFFNSGDSENFENDWISTGVYYNVISGKAYIDTEITVWSGEKYFTYENIRCTANYDNISSDMRKLLCLLLLSPVLSSSDNSTILGITGTVAIRSDLPAAYGIFGGAEEYSASGLGYQITSYPLMDPQMIRHGNMGCRLAFIG